LVVKLLTKRERLISFFCLEAIALEISSSNDLDKAFNELKDEDAFVCGGASIYKQTIDRVDTLYITHVDMEVDGDTFFPEINPAIWQEVWREEHEGFTFVKYLRVIPNPTG